MRNRWWPVYMFFWCARPALNADQMLYVAWNSPAHGAKPVAAVMTCDGDLEEKPAKLKIKMKK